MSKTKKLAARLGFAQKPRAEDEAPADEEEDAPADENEPDAEDGEDEDTAEDESDDADMDDGEDEDGDDAEATGADAGFALLDAPEAKGRGKLARELAKDVAAGRLTSGRAKQLLAAAPKRTSLAAAMEGRDADPGAAGSGDQSGKAAEAGWDRAIKSVNSRIPGFKAA